MKHHQNNSSEVVNSENVKEFRSRDEYFLECALEQAEIALMQKEVPVGCVATLNDKIIGFSYNLTNKENDPLAHAEFNVAKKLIKDGINLEEVTFYITIEPCAMCVGILQRNKSKIVYGYHNDIFGAKKILGIESGTCLKNIKCIEILQRFYSGTNEGAPIEKRIIKP